MMVFNFISCFLHWGFLQDMDRLRDDIQIETLLRDEITLGYKAKLLLTK